VLRLEGTAACQLEEGVGETDMEGVAEEEEEGGNGVVNRLRGHDDPTAIRGELSMDEEDKYMSIAAYADSVHYRPPSP